MADQPFLTIVTRCCKRPAMLAGSIRSVIAQTSQDIEQIFIVDRRGRGLKWANTQFDLCHDRLDGQYVYMLDDDGYLKLPGFVEQLHKAVQRGKHPDVVLVRAIMSNGRKLPPPAIWSLKWGTGARPRRWAGNGYCFAVKTKVWKRFTKHYHIGMGKTWHTGGDWHFATNMFRSKVRVMRLDVVAGVSKQRGRGQTFERCTTGWFETVAEQFGIEDVGDGDWRLRLWLRNQES